TVVIPLLIFLAGGRPSSYFLFLWQGFLFPPVLLQNTAIIPALRSGLQTNI
uniref:Uncharacterized protein n=1 Tax=Cyprinus carpio TaxID=7962 RepID=A0A8C2ACC9_CYPCA